MKPIFPHRMLVPAALAALAAACASTGGSPYAEPWSVIQTDVAGSADAHVIPVIVNRVDGHSSDRNMAVVAPGRHAVTVDVPPRRGFPASQHTFDLVAEPCTRYYVAARLKSFATAEWQPIVRSTARIGECEAKFATMR